MNKIFNKNSLFFWIALAVVLFFLLISYSDIYRNQLSTISDWKWRLLHHPEKADPSVMLIAIDNKSLNFMEEKLQVSWPWPREFYALVHDHLAEAGAASITFDILMDDPERDRMEFEGGSSDNRLAASLQHSEAAVLAAMIEDDKMARARAELQGLALEFENADRLPGSDHNSISLPLKEFRNGGASVGIANFIMDQDGICRRLPLLFRLEDRLLPQLAFAAYLKATGDSILSYQPRKNTLLTERSDFKLDKRGFYPIYWYGPGDADGVFRYDSFHAVMMSAVKKMQGLPPDIPDEEYRGKHIVICASASGLVDLKTTPFTSLTPYPGGEIHATLLSNLLNGHRLDSMPILPVAILALLFSALIAYSFLYRKLSASLLLTFGAAFILIAVNAWYFYYQSLDMDILLPLGSFLFSGSIASIYRTVNEGQAKRQMRNMFSRYLHNDVIDILLKDPDKVDLEGSEITGTVLFTDLQNFTTYSEDKTPQEVIRVLNKYFGIITSIVLKHGGLLDKYTGDGIMAVFGAPIARADHVKAACEVILEFREHNINEIIPTEGGVIATRIGVSSGPMVVGNLGSSQRMDYTAIGDTVNLSARLEGVNKSYGTTNLLSEYAWEFVKEDYLFRELDHIRVKGKNHPIRIFNLIDRHDRVSEKILQRERAFNEARSLYLQRTWMKAIKAFEKVLLIDPGDKAAEAYIDRCRLLKKHPDLVDEGGVFTFKTK